MGVAGIIVEYNPMHRGHVYLLEQTRQQLGEESAIVCIMSGDFVQRGDFALLRRQARARAAVESGADLVLELPLPWATASAEGFARGAVETLAATGVCTHLAFGSECGDAAALMAAAKALERDDLTPLLQEELKRGDSFAAARTRAVSRLAGQETAALLESPNNILGVEYCRAMLRCGGAMEPITVRRAGAAHDAPEAKEGFASASLIRAMLRGGQREEALSLMAEPMRRAFLEEEAAGRAPVFSDALERAMLFRLRSMTREDFAALDEGKEGLSNRLYEASRTAVSVEEILAAAKTKRYAYARLRRMVLWGCLGLRREALPDSPVYIRPLAANAVGRALLGRMRKEAALPVLTKSADVRRMGGAAEVLFTAEAAAADLYTLAYPNLSQAGGDTLWKEPLLRL